MKNLLEKYRRKNHPYGGRVPTPEELTRAALHPLEASDDMQKFMNNFPKLTENYRDLAQHILGLRPQS